MVTLSNGSTSLRGAFDERMNFFLPEKHKKQLQKIAKVLEKRVSANKNHTYAE